MGQSMIPLRATAYTLNIEDPSGVPTCRLDKSQLSCIEKAAKPILVLVFGPILIDVLFPSFESARNIANASRAVQSEAQFSQLLHRKL